MAETKKKAPAKKEKVEAAPAEEVKEVKPAKAKAPKANKEEKVEKVAKPSKPAPTEARATATNVRVTPRKVRLVLALVRGKDVKEALGILDNVNKAASVPVAKLIKSAAANATNNFGFDEEKLYVASIYANDGLRMKRYMPRAKGSASGLVKRTSHITCVVKMR